MIFALRHWRAIAAAAAAVALCAALIGWGIQIGQDRANARHAADIAAQHAAQIAQTKRMMRDVDTLAQEFEADRAVLAADRDRAAAAVIGLRKALAARAGANTATTSGGDGGPVGRALEQCAERYSELAGIADGYANQLIALQGWAQVVAHVE